MGKIRYLSLILLVASIAVYGFFSVRRSAGETFSAPEIHMDESTVTISVTDGTEAILQGVTASSGSRDLTDSLLVENLTHFIAPGKRQASIVAVDDNDRVVRVTREVVYSDYQTAKFSLTSPLLFNTGATRFTDGLSVEDCLDGDLSRKIKISSEEKIHVDTPGDYQAVFSVSNSAGDVAKLPVTVTILDPSEKNATPSIELSAYLINAAKGSAAIDPWSYVEKVTLRGKTYVPVSGQSGERLLADRDHLDELGEDTEEDENYTLRNIRVENPVDMNTPGVYEASVKVTCEDQDGSHTGTVRLIVVVEGEE